MTNLEYKLFDKYFIGLPPCNLAPFCQTGANSQVNSSGGWGSQVIAAVKLFFFVKYARIYKRDNDWDEIFTEWIYIAQSLANKRFP